MRSLFTRLDLLFSDEQESDAAMDNIADLCWEWVVTAPWVDETNLSGKWGVGEYKLNNTDTLLIQDFFCENGRFWRMKRTEWGREDTGLQIVNHVFIVRDDRRVEFSLLQDFVHQYESIKPSDAAVYPPWVIRAVVESYDCKMGDEQISQNWSSISPPNVPQLIEKIINPIRRLPIVLMSKRWDTKRTIIRPGSLSGRLSGLAHVYQLSDLNTRQFGEAFGRQWLGNGTIRIYWPGITRENIESNPSWDNMYSKRSFEEKYDSDEVSLRQDIINRICAATIALPASGPLVSLIRSRIDEEERMQEAGKLHEQRQAILGELKTTEEKVAYYEEEVKKMSGQITTLDIELLQSSRQIENHNETEGTLRFQIDKLSNENKALKSIKRILEEAAERNPDGGIDAFVEHINDYGKEEEEPEPEPQFNNLEEAIGLARKNLSRLKFLSPAIKSAKKTTSDANPSDVYDVFRELNDSVWPEIKSAIDQKRIMGPNRFNIVKHMKESFGGKYAEKESILTMDRYQRELNHKGRYFPLSDKGDIHIKIEPHLKLGSNDNPLRIHVLVLHNKSEYEAVHVSYNSNGKKVRKKINKAINDFPAIIIGWCGDHLPNARNNG